MDVQASASASAYSVVIVLPPPLQVGSDVAVIWLSGRTKL
ncbi:hypothetical protein S7335_53 [Synechococcus sp. PCC 7335]|nr:hypothetical protein S7335_53 [Synechococcus sp. PCC 7335]